MFVAAAGLASCNEESEPSTDVENETAACLWDTNDLLARVDAPAPGLVDCGILLGEEPLENDCFTGSLEAGTAAQITVNNCIDCIIYSTYVSTPAGGKFHLYREADYYGDAVRVVRVESCTGFGAGAGAGASCVDPTVLYQCSDPLPDPSTL